MNGCIDRLAAASLVAQVEQMLRQRIASGELAVGARLPSIRELARQWGIGKNTVIEAYERLLAQGTIRSRQGAGYFVTERWRELVPPPAERDEAAGPLWHLSELPAQLVLLGCGWLPESWRAMDEIAAAVRQTARMSRAELFDYGTPLGNPRLRGDLRRHLDALGIQAEASQILLTTGANHGLDLLARLLLKPGDAVLVESPGYYILFDLLRLQGIRLLPVPRGEHGPDVEALECLLAREQPKAFFINSVFHNPTGTILSAATAHRLLQLAERHDFWLVEDDVSADLQQESSVRLAELDQLRRVIYVGSFSKALSCALRVGYIAAPPVLMSGLLKIKMLTSITSSPFAEEIVATLLESGVYRKVAERLRRRLAAQWAQTLELLDNGGWQTFSRTAGGMFLWMRHPQVEDSMHFRAAALSRGVSLSGGSSFVLESGPCPWLRVNVSQAFDGRASAFLATPLTGFEFDALRIQPARARQTAK